MSTVPLNTVKRGIHNLGVICEVYLPCSVTESKLFSEFISYFLERTLMVIGEWVEYFDVVEQCIGQESLRRVMKCSIALKHEDRDRTTLIEFLRGIACKAEIEYIDFNGGDGHMTRVYAQGD